jgi:hypothetical protein
VDSLEQFIYSDSYAGYLVVELDQSMRARLNSENSLQSLEGDPRINDIQAILDKFPDVEPSSLAFISGDKLEKRRERLELISGKSLTDWNSMYKIPAADPAVAIDIYYNLVATDGVKRVFPKLRLDASLAAPGTPSVTGRQGYLYSNEIHGGLNAEAAWSRGITGDGVTIFSCDMGLNFSHDELDLSPESYVNYYVQGGNSIYQPSCAPGFPHVFPDCNDLIAHGTATTGIMMAKDDGGGVTGFAPSNELTFVHVPSADINMLHILTDGLFDSRFPTTLDMEPGSILAIIVGGDGPDGLGTYTALLDPLTFAVVRDATAMGVTVVVGSANGNIDLGNAGFYVSHPYFENLMRNDSGAIIVGASMGESKQRHPLSNCGSPVDVFAWGNGVVTTSYPNVSPHYEQAYIWQGNNPPALASSINNYYTDSFGGTSAATPMIVGAAALLQSYVKRELGQGKFFMPAKMKELLVNSGVSQEGGGCSIGVQPRIDVALNLADAFIADMRAQFPSLSSGAVMPMNEYISVMDSGVGLICRPYDSVTSDVSCPDEELYPVGEGAAASLDFDADGRADLVQWTNGMWKIDLSGRGAGGDNFGNWDIVINHPPIDARWVWPYVEDMNSDGRSDFVVYDKENGRWYIKYTDSTLLRTRGVYDGPWQWDLIVDHSDSWHDELDMDPSQSRYSRPAVADANDDGWLDISIACSDGIWRIDLGGPDGPDGIFDLEFEYLTREQLAAAPGWAYTTAVFGIHPIKNKLMYAYVKTPDGLPEEGRLQMWYWRSSNGRLVPAEYRIPYNFDNLYGGNDKILTPGKFWGNSSSWGGPAIKGSDGKWFISTSTVNYDSIMQAGPGAIYGGPDCHPIVADFDGDDFSDYAVMCPNEWRIVYSDEASFADLKNDDGVRIIPLRYDTSTLSLPGRSYSGGVSYRYVQKLIDAYTILQPDNPPPIPVDIVSIFVEN